MEPEGTPAAAAAAAPAPEANVAVDILSGGGLGLLLGIVVGMATSPVVGVVVGGLTSVLAVFLGLQGDPQASASSFARVRLNGLRIGSFGLAATIGLLGGLYIRINNPLVESPEHQLARWTAAFPSDPELAKKYMLFERTGLSPSMLDAGKDSPVAAKLAESAAAHRAGLFASEGQANLCRDLDPDLQFGGDSAKMLDAFVRQGEPFASVAKAVQGFVPAQRANALLAVHTFVCATEKMRRDKEGR